MIDGELGLLKAIVKKNNGGLNYNIEIWNKKKQLRRKKVQRLMNGKLKFKSYLYEWD